MAYIKDEWRFPDSTEYEYKFVGRFGAKGETRGKRIKPTPEQVARQNQLNREKKVRRLIKANFTGADYWVTFKYPQGLRPPLDAVKADWQEFVRRMRYAFKKAGQQLKFIYRIEIGSRGGIHVHAVINRCEGIETDRLIQETWTAGRVNFEHLRASSTYDKLAAYIVKPPSVEAQRHINLMPKAEQKELIKYSASRNLIRPEPVRKEYSHNTMRRLIEEGPNPSPGYFIDHDSIVSGVNAFTGMSYLHFTEIKLDPPKRGRPPKERKEGY